MVWPWANITRARPSRRKILNHGKHGTTRKGDPNVLPFLCPSVLSVVITCLDNRRAAQRGRSLVEQRSRREFQVGPSEASIPIQDRWIPWVNLADVDLIPLGRVSLLRILLSVISVLSVVPRSSCLPESSPRLSAPARTCGRGRLAQCSLPQRFAVWWVALPWPILPVPAVLLARSSRPQSTQVLVE